MESILKVNMATLSSFYGIPFSGEDTMHEIYRDIDGDIRITELDDTWAPLEISLTEIIQYVNPNGS